MEAALEAANPAKTSRLDMGVIPFFLPLGFSADSNCCRYRLGRHNKSDLHVQSVHNELQIPLGIRRDLNWRCLCGESRTRFRFASEKEERVCQVTRVPR